MTTEIAGGSATSLVPSPATEDQVPATLADVAERAVDYARQAKAENTRRAYRSDWRDFTAWCAENGVSPMPAPPAIVGLNLTARAATLKTSTLGRRLTAISQAHRAKGRPLDMRHPAIRETWAGIRRSKGTMQRGKAPAVTADLKAMVAELPDTLRGVRDRALLLVGFSGAFRRSELVAVDVDDCEFTRDGLVITLRRSKTDQDGAGRKVGLPYGSNPATCPIRSLQAWLEVAGIEDGPVFRSIRKGGRVQDARLSDRSVALIVKRAATASGLDPAIYAGHSLRAGLVTSAAAAGVPERAIMAQTGHKSLVTLRRYIRDGSLFRENAAAGVGL